MKYKTSTWRILLVLFVITIILAVPLAFFPGSNVYNRVATTFQIVDNQKLDIDPWKHKSNDGAIFNGHTYCDKALGVSLLGVPSYWIFKTAAQMTEGMPVTDYKFYRAARHFIRVTTLLPLILIAAWLMASYLRKQRIDSIWIAPAWIFGTVAFPFSLLLFSHQYAASLLVIGFFCLYKYKTEDKQRESWAMPVFSGLCVGFAIFTEYPAAIIALILGLYFVTFERRIWRVLQFGFFGAVLPGIAILLNNWLTFGGPFNMAYSHLHDKTNSAGMDAGILGVGLPKLSSLYEITFSPAGGLFFTGPWLLFAALGLLLMLGRKGQRVEGIIFLLIIGGYFIFNAGYWEPGGAMSFGPRHLIPMVPFLALLAYYGGMSLGSKIKSIFLALVTFSVIITAFGTFADPTMPDRLKNPIFEFAFPVYSKGYGLESIINLSGVWLFFLFLCSMGLMLLLVEMGKKKPKAQRAENGDVITESKVLFEKEELAPVGDKSEIDIDENEKTEKKKKKKSKKKKRKLQPVVLKVNWFFAILALFVFGYMFVVPYVAKTDPGIKNQVLGNYFMARGVVKTIRHRTMINKEALMLAQDYYKKATVTRADPNLHFYRAKALLYLNRNSEARVELVKVLKISPDFPQRDWIINALEKIPHGL